MFATLLQPYAIAGQTITETATSTYKTLSSLAIATYETLTSDQAQRVYRDTWTVTRVVVQVTALALYAAGLYTLIAGRACRRYYKAEWAADVQQLLTYPDRCLADAESAVEPAAELIVTDAEAAQPAIPVAVQAILDSNVKTTKKLRAIATHFDIRWRNAHGKGRHLINNEIKTALSEYPEILAALA
jgi:hypothetical protein